MYKAVFIDIDGTILNSQKQISNKTREIIKQVTEKGILVVICSGRPRRDTENISKDCNASKYVITSNGSAIYDYIENKIISLKEMDAKACIELFKIAESIGARLIMNTNKVRVVNRMKKLDGSEKQLDVSIEEFVKNNKIEQCVISDSNFDNIKGIKPKIEAIPNVAIKNQHKSLLDDNVPKKGNIYYDVANVENNKGNGIIEFCEMLNIDLKDTVAIGDDYNDLSMFRVVGHSVAMGNANNEIKQFADEVTLSNDEDGVAIFLEKLLKENME